MAHSVVLQSTDPVALVFEALQGLQSESGTDFIVLDETRAAVLVDPDTIEIWQFGYDDEGDEELEELLGCVKLVKQEVT